MGVVLRLKERRSLAHLSFFFSVTCVVMCKLLAQCVCVRAPGFSSALCPMFGQGVFDLIYSPQVLLQTHSAQAQ